MSVVVHGVQTVAPLALGASIVFTVIFGALIGASELVSRYKDNPVKAVSSFSALLYIYVNALASLGAILLIRVMGWLSSLSDTPARTLILQTMLAAFGAMAFFRTSLFTLRVGSTDIQVGPASFLQVILNAADRACDRNLAEPRATAVAEIMSNISFAKAKDALPALCFGLMQNISSQESENFRLVVQTIQNSQMGDSFKANNLGLALMNVVGEKVLRQAIAILRRAISDPPRPILQSIATLQLLSKVDYGKSCEQLIDQCLLLAGQFQNIKYKASLDQARLRISNMVLNSQEKVLYLSVLLITEFGEQILQISLQSLPENAGVVPAPAPPAPGEDAAPAPGHAA